VLDDNTVDDRSLGIAAGLAWGKVAELTVVYTDLGISPGMKQGIDRAKEEGRPIEHRSIWERPGEPSREATIQKLYELRDFYTGDENRKSGWDGVARNAAIKIWLEDRYGPLVIEEATMKFIASLIDVLTEEENP
jgi:hypothetical protein